MTIPEAAQLVIQAGAMAKGGEVFVLDMGQPVKIADLAHHVISLSGLELKSEQNPEGDIEIEITGLRPGEKLYEELLIGENPEPTPHPRILKANEVFKTKGELQEHLDLIQQALQSGYQEKIIARLQIAIPGYIPNHKHHQN